MVTLQDLIKAAQKPASERLELLLLLSALAGLLTSILYRPAVDVINNLLAALNTATTPDGQQLDSATEILIDGVPAIILGQLSLILITAFLIPFWARASSPDDLTPGEGGSTAFFERGILALKYMLSATGLTILSFIVIVPIAAGLSQLLGSLGSLVIITGAALVLWLNFVWSATANVAIVLSTDKTSITFRAAWSYTRIFLRPIVGFFAFLWLMAIVINLLLGNMVTQLLPAEVSAPLALVLSGGLSFASNALHISGLFRLSPSGIDNLTD